jgi:hypothetical protein
MAPVPPVALRAQICDLIFRNTLLLLGRARL